MLEQDKYSEKDPVLSVYVRIVIITLVQILFLSRLFL